jgi:tripeptide aminopeptidase
MAGSAPYTVSPAVKDIFDRLSCNPLVQKGLAFLESDHGRTIAEQKEICAIPSPPFGEERRAKDYERRLALLGLTDVRRDAEGNAIGLRPGTGKGPTLLVAAHLDTVFPQGTDLTMKETNGILRTPGIGDDARGLAAILSVVRAFNETGITTLGDILFCGDVGEEGLGDLRGVKALFRGLDVDGFITVDGDDFAGIGYLATGSRRYEVTFEGPGGHSFSAFGRPSAVQDRKSVV